MPQIGESPRRLPHHDPPPVHLGPARSAFVHAAAHEGFEGHHRVGVPRGRVVGGPPQAGAFRPRAKSRLARAADDQREPQGFDHGCQCRGAGRFSAASLNLVVASPHTRSM